EQSLAELGDVIFVGFADAADEPMNAQSFEDATDLACIFSDENILQAAVCESTDVMLAPEYRQHCFEIGCTEQIESSPRPLPTVTGGACDGLKRDSSLAGIFSLCDKLQVSPRGCLQQLVQIAQAVDRSFERCQLITLPTVFLRHLAVVLVKRDFIAGAFKIGRAS